MSTLAAPAVARTGLEGFEAVTLTCGALEAAFVPAAGLVCASLRHAGEELLGQRSGLAAYAERDATMGIPFLHPWANRVATDTFTVAGREVRAARSPHEEHGLPIHGVLPGRWEVLGAAPKGEHSVLRARLRFADPAFPFPHEVEQLVSLSERALRIQTTLSHGPVPVAFGFHPYLRLPGVRRSSWAVGLPRRARLLADDRGLPTGDSVAEPAQVRALADRTFDDGYERLGGTPFTLEGGGRRLEVAFLRGYTHAQVFAPPDDDVVCFEPMTAPANALVSGRGLRVLEEGATFTAAFELRVASS
jgi:aldose 1-epimerase